MAVSFSAFSRVCCESYGCCCQPKPQSEVLSEGWPITQHIWEGPDLGQGHHSTVAGRDVLGVARCTGVYLRWAKGVYDGRPGAVVGLLLPLFLLGKTSPSVLLGV